MRFTSSEPKAAVIFEEMGFRYMGPIDGHDFDVLTDVISNARKIPGPVLLHVKTVKGKGFEPAELDKRTFHGCGPFELENGKIVFTPGTRPTFSDAFAEALTAIADRDKSVIGITAAMPDGTKLAKFAKKHPDRYFDVGIAEAHAVCFAAGAATSGIKPVVAIYSTFLQRAYDQVVHDVSIQNLPVVFAMDRAGVGGRRRSDAHGPLRHRVPADATEHDDHGAAHRGRTGADARARAELGRTGRAPLPAR